MYMSTNLDTFLNDDRFQLNNKNIFNIMKNIPIQKKNEKNIIEEQKINKKTDNDFFIPSHKDTLFWCWFLFSNNHSIYEIKSQDAFKHEMKCKFDCIERVKKNKEIFKKNKIKLSKIESNLQEKMIDFNGFQAILLLNEVNLVYIDKYFYYEKCWFPGKKTCFICKFENKYGVWDNENEAKFFDFKKKRIIVENINKKIKSISSYKAPELVDICIKLNIEYKKDNTKGKTKNKTKKELYKEITEKVMNV